MIILTAFVYLLSLFLLNSLVLGKGPLGAHQNVQCLENNDNQPSVVTQSVVLGKKRIRPIRFPDDVEDFFPPEKSIMRMVSSRAKRRYSAETEDDVDDKFDKILRMIDSMETRKNLREDAEWMCDEPWLDKKKGRNRRKYGNDENECMNCRIPKDAEDDWDVSVERDVPRRSFLRRLECEEDSDDGPFELNRYSARRRPRKSFRDISDREPLHEWHRGKTRKPAQDILYIPNFDREMTSHQPKKKRRLKEWR